MYINFHQHNFPNVSICCKSLNNEISPKHITFSKQFICSFLLFYEHQIENPTKYKTQK